MSPKRKSVCLTIAEKYDIILRKSSGESVPLIRQDYGISRTTMYNICVHSEEIRYQFENSTLGFSFSTKRETWPGKADVDKIVLYWYLRCKERKVHMTGAEIRRKALEINEKIHGNPDFKACASWLIGFKKRYQITSADIREDLPTAAKFAATEAFTADFNRLLQENGFTLKNVYNVAYTAIMWKAVPENTSILKSAQLTENLKMCEEYVTALLCANATGCHRLPVVIIGNFSETQRLYNFNIEAIYAQWYKDYFLESVKERQESENGRREKSLLLLDNTPSLLDLDDFNKIDPFVTVMSPPLDVSPLRLPMNCGIITCFRRKFRKELLETIRPLPIYNREQEVIDAHKQLSLWDCCRIARDAWFDVDDAILKMSWDSLLQRKIIRMEYTEKWRSDLSQIIKLLRTLPGCELCGEVEVLKWYHIDDEYDIVKKIFTDEVLEEYKDNTLGSNVSIEILDDQAEPSNS